MVAPTLHVLREGGQVAHDAGALLEAKPEAALVEERSRRVELILQHLDLLGSPAFWRLLVGCQLSMLLIVLGVFIWSARSTLQEKITG